MHRRLNFAKFRTFCKSQLPQVVVPEGEHLTLHLEKQFFQTMSLSLQEIQN